MFIILSRVECVFTFSVEASLMDKLAVVGQGGDRGVFTLFLCNNLFIYIFLSKDVATCLAAGDGCRLRL